MVGARFGEVDLGGSFAYDGATIAHLSSSHLRLPVLCDFHQGRVRHHLARETL